jgi:carboxypeptidase PM20D1
MRRVLKWIGVTAALLGVALAALAAVLAYNVVQHRSRQLDVAALPPVDVNETAAANRLGEAIRFKTISNALNPEQDAEPLRAMQAHLLESFPAFHAVATREIVGGHSLLYTWQGSDPAQKPIALLAHQDVVPIAPKTESDWEQPPFDGLVRDGFVWGRGSWDDKGNLYSMLEAAEKLAREGFKPKRTIYFAFGHDEEVSGQRGAKAIAECGSTTCSTRAC